MAMESEVSTSQSTSYVATSATSTSHELDLLSSSDEESTSNCAVFLLSRLKSPRESDLERKRKVTQNSPPKGKRPCQGATAAEPKNINAYPLMSSRTILFYIISRHLSCSSIKIINSFMFLCISVKKLLCV